MPVFCMIRNVSVAMPLAKPGPHIMSLTLPIRRIGCVLNGGDLGVSWSEIVSVEFFLSRMNGSVLSCHTPRPMTITRVAICGHHRHIGGAREPGIPVLFIEIDDMKRLLLLSNSAQHGHDFLDHAACFRLVRRRIGESIRRLVRRVMRQFRWVQDGSWSKGSSPPLDIGVDETVQLGSKTLFAGITPLGDGFSVAP